MLRRPARVAHCDDERPGRWVEAMPSSVLNDIRYTRLSGGGEGASKTEGALRDVHSMWLTVMVNGKEGTE